MEIIENLVKYDWKSFVKFYFIIWELEQYFRTFKIELKVNLWKLNILIFNRLGKIANFWTVSELDEISFIGSVIVSYYRISIFVSIGIIVWSWQLETHRIVFNLNLASQNSHVTTRYFGPFKSTIKPYMSNLNNSKYRVVNFKFGKTYHLQ